MLGKFSCFCCLLSLIKIYFFQKILQEFHQSVEQLVLILVQTVCKGYQQNDKSSLAGKVKDAIGKMFTVMVNGRSCPKNTIKKKKDYKTVHR